MAKEGTLTYSKRKYTNFDRSYKSCPHCFLLGVAGAVVLAVAMSVDGSLVRDVLRTIHSATISEIYGMVFTVTFFPGLVLLLVSVFKESFASFRVALAGIAIGVCSFIYAAAVAVH